MEAKRRLRRLAGMAEASVLVFGLAAPTALMSQYEPHLQYQPRGDRHEGLHPGPVGGFDVELVSALVEYREVLEGWPEQVRLRFYLDDADDAHVTVRELEYRAYYWLDKVKPVTPWQPAAYNEYSWSSETVLQDTSLEMYDLGAVVTERRLAAPELPREDAEGQPAGLELWCVDVAAEVLHVPAVVREVRKTPFAAARCSLTGDSVASDRRFKAFSRRRAGVAASCRSSSTRPVAGVAR